MNSGKKSGFSLIELIIVVGIISAMIALAIPYYGDYVKSSKLAVQNSNFFAIKKAVMEYHADKGVYPADANALIVLTQPPNKYLMEIPVDPDLQPGDPATWGYNVDNNAASWGAKYFLLTNP